MGDVLDNFIGPMKRQFSIPKQADGDEAGFWADYINALRRFDNPTLMNAACVLIQTRLTRTFPTVGECYKACKETIEAEAIEQLAGQLPNDRAGMARANQRDPEWAEDRIRNAYLIMRRSELGFRSAREHWIWQLFDFCRMQQRLPDIHEAKVLVQKSQRTLNRLLDFVKSPAPDVNFLPQRQALLNFWSGSYGKHCEGIGIERKESTAMLQQALSPLKEEEAA